MNLEVNDTYEASFYLMNGGWVEYIKFKRVESKSGYSFHWTIIMSGVSQEDQLNWKNYKAIGNLRDFSNARLKIKKLAFRVQKRDEEQVGKTDYYHRGKKSIKKFSERVKYRK